MTQPGDIFSDTHELRRLAARASTLDERMAGGFLPIETTTQYNRQRVEHWRSKLSVGQLDRLGERLAHANWPELLASQLIGPVELAQDMPLPAWTERLPQLLASVSAASAPSTRHTDPLPFVDLFRPLARALVYDLDRRHPLTRWSEAARSELESSLFHRLAPLFADSLYQWFRIFREVQESAFTDAVTDPAGPPTAHIYAAYLDWLRNGHLQRLVRKRPVLGRLFVLVVEQWEAYAAELVDRLESDYSSIVQLFFHSGDPGLVIGLATGVADPHDHGRRVAIVRFASGAHLVYKPRDLSIDLAFGALLAWLRERGASPDLRAPSVLCRSGYGWCEFIEASPCRDRSEVAFFYRRTGALLSLVHVLGGSDLHEENVIAEGSQPVLIDLETLLGLEPMNPSQSDLHPALMAANQRIRRSVLAAGYLPRWTEFRGQALGRSGLAQSPAASRTATGLQHINTDAMRYGPVPVPPHAAQHLPVLDDVVQQPADHADDIEAGFRSMARLLADHREMLRAGPLRAFRQVSIRTVRRDTQLYTLLRQRALQPDKLCDGVEFGLEFEFLFRLESELGHANFQQIELERRALARLDIPCFRMRADTMTIYEACGGSFHLPADVGVTSPWQRLMDRLERLDEEEIELQCGLIRLSFKHRPRETWHPSPWPSADGGWSAEHAIERATALGEVIARYAIERDDGAAWLGIVAVGQEERLQYDTAGFDLYAGSGGIAVFLAALFRVTGRAAFRDLSQRALLPMVELAHHCRQASLWARALGVGGAVGLGSMIYSLVRVAELAELPQLRHDARIVTELLTPELIGADTTFDVIDGSAGAILGLLALAATGEASALAKAIECGRHLLSVGREKLLPPSCPTPHLGGFAHGASGIAYSLQRLAEASRDLAFARAAARWVDAERRLFDARAGNWVDLRFSKDGVNSFSCNWCHGAVGVGLARLGVELVDTAAMHEIDIALTTTRDHAMGVRDHLCCGNFGRLELLLTAGTKLHRPDLVALARDRAATRLHANRDGFAWVLGTDSDNPGFFQGISGIGYQLLRLARPHELPSILLWH